MNRKTPRDLKKFHDLPSQMTPEERRTGLEPFPPAPYKAVQIPRCKSERETPGKEKAKERRVMKSVVLEQATE